MAWRNKNSNCHAVCEQWTWQRLEQLISKLWT